MDIVTEAFGITPTLLEMEGVENRGQDLSPGMEAIKDDFEFIVNRQFETNGGYRSGGWAPLDPEYRVAKAKQFPGRGLLERQGHLRGSFFGGPGSVSNVGSHSLTLGSDDPVARYHQEGTSKMPARPIVQINPLDRKHWVTILDRYLESGRVGGPLTGVLAGL